MKKVLVFVEAQGSALKKSSLEALSVFDPQSYTITTVSIGTEKADALQPTLSSYGVQTHYSASQKQYNPDAYQKALANVFEKVQPDFVIASANNLSRDIFPRLAAQFNAAYMSDITEISTVSELKVRRPLYSGKCMAQVTFTDESAKILLIRPNQVTVIHRNLTNSTQMVDLGEISTSGRTQTLSIESGESEKLDLTEADVIVSGGRGLKEAEHFKLLEELAQPLNATVGASRAVVDLGWVPHNLQVGQTGKTVAPTLYIAVGISGAIQHLAGMSGSKNIVAINKDDKAPIFQKATYGIVGDLFEVVPALTEKLKSIR